MIMLMKVELKDAIKFNDLKPRTSLQWIFGDIKAVAAQLENVILEKPEDIEILALSERTIYR